METYIIKPKNKKDAEIALKKMRIPIEKVSSINEEEELIPMEDFFKDLNKRLKKHYTKKVDASSI
jgi:lipoate-protein ligase A